MASVRAGDRPINPKEIPICLACKLPACHQYSASCGLVKEGLIPARYEPAPQVKRRSGRAPRDAMGAS